MTVNDCFLSKARFLAMSTDETKLRIELGRAALALEDVVRLRAGALLSLDRRIEDLVDVVVDGQLVARGEVVIVDEKFCVRIVERSELQASADTIHS